MGCCVCVPYKCGHLSNEQTYVPIPTLDEVEVDYLQSVTKEDVLKFYKVLCVQQKMYTEVWYRSKVTYTIVCVVCNYLKQN